MVCRRTSLESRSIAPYSPHNLDPRNGLCNGTHLVVRAVDKHIIDVEFVNGTHGGDRVFIPRILMSLSEDLSLPFNFKRK
jgi:ATP-dependent DNA helicase PIF1